VILSLLSFVGDRYPLSTTIRLLFQFTASFIFLFGLWNNHPLSTAAFLMVIPLAIYIVGTTNYYNFMDGINGLAAITGAVGFGLLAFYGVNTGTHPSVITLSIAIVFCCLGFLPFNMPNAKVFMGDVGSILLGFVFAVMVVWYSTGLKEFLCLASFLFPFYADEITTELIRLKDGEKLWLPHRKHLYQLLANEYNISHWKISLGYGIGQLIIGASILFLFKAGIFAIMAILFLYFCIFSVVSVALRKKLINEI
jgi:Fuc2NAc and GlcNAc transferase